MNSVYENYMRSVLGYEPVNFNYRNTYEQDYYGDIDYTNYSIMQQTNPQTANNDLEQCYPDIYKLVYPMVQKRCMQNTRNVTRELIDEMTNEIYFAIEDDNLNRGIEQEKINNMTNIENRSTINQKTDNKNTVSTQNNRSIENRKEENRQRVRNQGLSDLIRILILREFLNRPGFRPRPPIPPPPRPPFPPGQNQPRPPMPPPQRPGFGRPIYNRDLYEQDY